MEERRVETENEKRSIENGREGDIHEYLIEHQEFVIKFSEFSFYSIANQSSAHFLSSTPPPR